MNIWKTIAKSVRDVLRPAIVIWAVVTVLAIAHLFFPTLGAAMERVRPFLADHIFASTILSRVFFCGLLPGLFLFTQRRIRPRHPFAVITAQTLWCGVWGPVCDGFFRLLEHFLGAGTDLGTIAAKTVVDQFLFTPFIIAPAGAAFFFWMARDFSFRRTAAEWPQRFWRGLVAPNLFANWCVWIPAEAVVYLFPVDLQIHVNGAICSLWLLLCLRIGTHTR